MNIEKAKRYLEGVVGRKEKKILKSKNVSVYPIFNYNFDAWRVDDGNGHFDFALHDGKYIILKED